MQAVKPNLSAVELDCYSGSLILSYYNHARKARGKDLQQLSVEELFVAAQESYEEAQQRALEENKTFTKTEYYRLDKLGIYRLRVLPIAPNPDGTSDRRSYEYPVRQLLMELENRLRGMPSRLRCM